MKKVSDVLELQCEQCGRWVEIEDENLSSVSCANCRKGRSAVHVGVGCGLLVKRLAPWATSVIIHVIIALAMVSVVFIVRKAPPSGGSVEPVWTVPIWDLELGDVDDDPSAVRVKPASRHLTRRDSSIAPDTGVTSMQIRLQGGDTVGGQREFAGMKIRGGAAFFGERGVRAGEVMYHIVFVVDRSGSMVDVFDDVCEQVMEFVGRLRVSQDFHLIFFAENKPIESSSGKLVAATRRNKLAVVDFLDMDRNLDLIPKGRTVALPALQRAFEVLKSADVRGGKRKGKLVFLVTDGNFESLGGGSEYAGKFGNEAVIQWLRDNNADASVHVSTFLFDRDDGGSNVMKQVAAENGGSFRLIGVDD